ncbi:hypothetical protein CW751_02285 [Brumimicrobium salinarum]|uniref:Uncharacterized protein n=1 Tax=Brumimicrobium salinarum TaxID=2058658 RepID=A0A2I0R711_9FLAO|nr:hypothetical protein [Brumimicrobium salinarum]PKR82180.1 hypothetical protein CW751_02285 [Brumimicrobium salinarum]
MLKNFIVITLFSLASYSFAQTNHDARLLTRYTSEELTKIEESNPEEYAIINHALDVGISIGDFKEGEGKEIKFDGVLDKDPTKEHTYISLGIDLINRYQYFKFEGSNKIVVVRPKNLILKIK